METGFELKQLAEEVFQKMKIKADEEGEEDDSIRMLNEDPSFKKLFAFLHGSDTQYEELIVNLLVMTSAQFPPFYDEFTDSSKHPPEIVMRNIVKFTMRTHLGGNLKEFALDYVGFWLICLTEVGRGNVAATLHSFEIPGLGSFCDGELGQSTAWAHLASHVERQRQPLVKVKVEEARAESLEEAKDLVKLLQFSQEWDVDFIHLAFEEADNEFWSKFSEQLLRFPTTKLETNDGALIGCKKEDLRSIWDSGVKKRWEVDGLEFPIGDWIWKEASYEGKEQQWESLVKAQAKQERFLISKRENKKGFLARLETQGASCPSGHPLKRINDQLHWTCSICGELTLLARPWRCIKDRRLEENPGECDTPFDVNHACMVKYARAEPDVPQLSEDEDEEEDKEDP